MQISTQRKFDIRRQLSATKVKVNQLFLRDVWITSHFKKPIDWSSFLHICIKVHI